MRIAILTTDAYGALGGIAAYNRDLIEALAGMPDVGEILVIPRTQAQTSDMMAPEKARVIAGAAGSKVRFIGAVLAHALERTDLLVCGHINLLPVAGALRVALRCPMVLVVYGIDAWQAPSLWVRTWLRQVTAVWSISALTRDRMNEWACLPASMVAILPNAVRLERYGIRPRSEALQRRYALQGKKVLMTFGRLSAVERYKGVDEVLEVMPSLLVDEPLLTYLVAGDGDDRSRLQRKAQELGLGAHVVFAGRVPEDEKADHYGLCDVFVMPSRGEGFGFVFLEALACGVPVVGSATDGSREALRDGLLGELADPADRSSLTAAIKKALQKPRGIQPALEHFAWPQFTQRLAAALADVSIEGR